MFPSISPFVPQQQQPATQQQSTGQRQSTLNGNSLTLNSSWGGHRRFVIIAINLDISLLIALSPDVNLLCKGGRPGTGNALPASTAAPNAYVGSYSYPTFVAFVAVQRKIR